MDVDLSGGLRHGCGAWSAVATLGSAFDAGALRVRDFVVGREAGNAALGVPLALILFGVGHCDCGDEGNAVRVQAYHRSSDVNDEVRRGERNSGGRNPELLFSHISGCS